jgi:glutamine amidotransferase
MIAIIDYGLGNVASVQKALKFLGFNCQITDNHKVIKSSNVILLPGVGSFAQGMENLHQRNLVDLLTEEVVVNQKAFLGICLGMQLILEMGTEPQPCQGLGWIKGKVVKFEDKNLTIPHMGWNNIQIHNSTYLNNLPLHDFYFIHSYHVVPEEPEVIAATVNYGSNVVACVQKENIFATQFHPEKSQSAGLTLLKNFMDFHA